MLREFKTDLGMVDVARDVLATYIGLSATNCFATLLGRDSVSRGVEIAEKDDSLQVNVYIIVGYGTKISEIANNVMHRIQYNVREYLGIQLDNINIIVQGVRILD